MTSIVWFRRDLRIDDNPALSAAVQREQPIVPLFIWAPQEEKPWERGEASRWWLHRSLEALSADLKRLGSRLIIRSGNSLEILTDLTISTDAETILWNRLYDPAIRERDVKVESALRKAGRQILSFNASLLFEPTDVSTQKDEPYKVFTPFWKQCRSQAQPPKPQAAPSKLPVPKKWPKSKPLKDLELLPKIDWAKEIRSFWNPGTEGARENLERFIDEALPDYSQERNSLSANGTSLLSPHLHFGEISVRRIFHDVYEAGNEAVKHGISKSANVFLSEIGWREFSHHLLYHFPHTTDRSLREHFKDFPWNHDKRALNAWQKGRTGYPVVDAAMRQLWRIGWMHNRARMIVASFLTKDLLIPWQDGARWFWDTLVDADLANNTLGWQWTAGCGADAAPYFRIFNPVTQGEKFDPDGEYIRRWVPELKDLPIKFIHKPWEAPEAVLQKAGIKLGGNYPKRIVDHKEAREEALTAYNVIKKS